MPRAIWVLLAVSLMAAACGGGDSVFSTGWTTQGDTATPGEAPPSSGAAAPISDVLPPEASTIIQTAAWGEVFDRRIVVRLAEGAGAGAAHAAAAAVRGKVVARVEGFSIAEIELTAGGEAALAAALQTLVGHPAVAIAAPSSPLPGSWGVTGAPCGPLDSPVLQAAGRGNQHSLIGVEEAWRLVRASGVAAATPTIGIVDGWGGHLNYHGGWVAATIASPRPSDLEPPGVLDAILGEDAATFFEADVFGSRDRSSVTAYLNGVRLLVQSPQSATVVNLSLGGVATPGEQAIVRQFLRDLAVSHPQVLVVAAAGNEAVDLAAWAPGGLNEPNLVTVGGLSHQGDRWQQNSTDANGVEKAYGSNYMGSGGEVTLAVIAQDTFTGINTNGEPKSQSGTSFAAPQVTAAAAVLQALDPTLTAAEIKQILVDTAATDIANPAISDRIKEVDPALGGRVLRVDNAVWHVLSNRLRVTGDRTREEVAARATLQVQAHPDQGDPLTYVIWATAPGGGNDTTVRITVGTNAAGGLVPGQTSQTTVDDVAGWHWLFSDIGESAQLTLTRTDTGACARIALTAAEPTFLYAGTYAGEFVLLRFDSGQGDLWAPAAVFTLVVDGRGNAIADGGVRDSVTGPSGTGRIDFSFDCEGLVAADGTLTCAGTGHAEVHFTYTNGSPDDVGQNDGPLVLTLVIGADGSLSGSVTEDGQGAGFPVQGRAVSGGPTGLP